MAPLKQHLRQKEVGAEGSCQETQAEGPPGAGVLHGDPGLQQAVTASLQGKTTHRDQFKYTGKFGCVHLNKIHKVFSDACNEVCVV